MESFASFGGDSPGGSGADSKASSFLQLPLPAAPAPAPDERLASPVASLHQYLLAGSAAAAQHSQLKEAAAAAAQGEISPADAEIVKAKIVSHPQYSALLAAYLECQKVGAPPDVLDSLSAVAAKLEAPPPAHGGRREHDPELDQFMEAYCNMLVKYRDELARPIQEAAEFLRRVEAQLDSITDSNCEGAGSSEDDQDTSCPEEIDPCAEDKELKHRLLRKYGGYLGSLRQEFSKRKKKGKLPKEARQKLLHWWELHYKWPYPSETEKMALAESTGLDQKQINNWFINQRKRHWKPAPEETPFSMMDGAFHVHAPHHPQGTAALYMDRPAPFMVDGMYRFGS